MKKRILSLLIVLSMLCGFLPQGIPTVSAAVESGTCGDNLTWTLDDEAGLLTISGTGDMYDYGSAHQAPWATDYSKYPISPIKTLVIEDGVTCIGNNAFYWLDNVDSITIPESVTRIGDYAFSYYSSGISEFVIPNGVTSIGDHAFSHGCMDAFSLPDSLTGIGDHAFSFCWSIKNITIPENVTSIGDYAFSYCSDLQSVTVMNPDCTIGDADLTLGEAGQTVICGHRESTARHYANKYGYVFKEICDHIYENGTCTNCGTSQFVTGTYGENLTWQIDTGTGLLTISGTGSMSDDTPWKEYAYLIKEIEIKEGVTSVPDYVFKDLNHVTSLVVASSVSTIGFNALEGCSALTSLTVLNPLCFISDSVATLGNYENTVIYGYPHSTAQAYAKKHGYSFVAAYNHSYENDVCTICGFKRTAGGSCGTASIWEFDKESGKLTISGTGSVGSEKPWLDYAHLITSLEIQEGITEIADYGFTELGKLTEAILPESLRKVGSYAFLGCDSLESVTVLNLDCDISMHSYTFGSSSETVIYGHVPSTAQHYAAYSWKTFRALCDHSFTDGFCVHCGRSNTAAISGTDGLIWEINIETSTLTASGNGVAKRPELDYLASYAKSLVIREGVTGIGDRAFYGFNSLTSVSLPTGITEIGQWAFYNCDGLTSITIPNTVRTVEDCAFNECDSLTEVTIPVGITNMGRRVFGDCSGLVAVTLPADMTTIPEAMFYNCKSLESITIPESVTTIGIYAFDECSALTSITIPESVTAINAGAFEKCSALTSITIPESVTEIGYGAFRDCDGLTSVIIPDSVTSFDYGVFSYCDGLVSITIPNSLTKIPDGIFSYCTGLKSVTIPDGVTCIGCDAFSGCSELTNITIPDSVTSIGSAAFSNCDSLTSIIIPNGVTSIPSYLFDSCSNLTDVVLPDTITSIEYDAFANCKALANIAIPHSVTSVGSNAFINCTSLTELDLPEGLTHIEYRAFSNCTGLKAMVLPANLTYIGEQAFDGCTGLTEIMIPDSVTKIGLSAFEDCRNLKNITLPDHELCIEERAFGGTAYYNDPGSWEADVLYIGKHLIEAKTTKAGVYEIPNGTFSIADGAFRNCQDLTEVIIPDGITRIPIFTFENCSSLESVTVPNTVSVIEFSAFAECSSLKNVTIPEGVSAICGYTFTKCSALEYITIPESVTEIAHNAFYRCTALRSVTIPSSVANIGSYAFEGCTGLENVTIHEGVACIEYCAFSGCTGLTEVVLPNSLERIEESAFANCAALERAVVPGSLKYIGECIFTNCSSLRDITLHNGLPKISWGMFQNCTSLTEVLIPDSVTEIGMYAFTDCISLSSITLPEHEIIINDAFTGTAYYNDINNWENDILYIGKHLIKANPGITGPYVIPDGTLTVAANAFSECTGLTGISIPNSVANLCDSAFRDCAGLERVTVPHSVKAIHDGVFFSCTNLSEIVLPDTALAINSSAFYETAYYRNDNNWSDNMLYIGKHLVSGNPYKISDCVVREGTLTIADYAFYVDITRSASMDTLTLPDSLLRIGASAFANAGGFQETTIPENVQSIGAMAFRRAATNAITILNPNCDIADSEYTFEPWDVEPLVLYGYEGSTIQAYAEKYGYPFVALDPKPIVDENIQMGHTLNLANDISINFAVPADQLDGYDSYYLECVSTVGKTAEKRSTGGMRIDPIRSGDYYYFVLDGITSIEMNDVYEATLHMTKDGVSYVSTLDSYSVADYAYSQLNKPNYPEKLKKVCANMLQYGAAAQIWKNYRTDALATDRMTEEHKAYLVDPSTVVFGDNSAKLNDIDNPTIKLIGKSLSLESKVIIRFIIDATNWKDRLDELSLHVTYETLEGTTETVVIDTCEEYLLERNFYSFSFDSLRSAELRSVVSAAVYHGDTQISTTMQYSVDSYGNGKTGTMLTLCQAMIAYSDVALAFFS